MFVSNISPKLIYLARRNPDYSRYKWTARWRQHGALGMAQPRWVNVERYVHCDLIEPVGDQRAFLSDHDGVGIIWHRSIAHRDAHFADTRSQSRMVGDECDTFAQLISETCIFVKENVLTPIDKGARYHLLIFDWGEKEPPRPKKAVGCISNTPLPGPAHLTTELDCRRIDEFWFTHFEDALDAARVLHTAHCIMVIGNDCELYRRQT